MALAELIFGEKKTTVDGGIVGAIQFDIVREETYTDQAEITSHPVEVGSDVTDHIKMLPAILEINGVVTNTPIAFLASVTAPSPVRGSLKPSDDRADDAYAMLRQLQRDGVVLSLATILRDYENMVIQDLTATKSADTGEILDCNITFTEILKAKDISIQLPIPIKVVNKKPTKKGGKDPKNTSDKQGEKATSTLKKGANLVSKFLG
jgi:hypothetical protein